MSALNQNVVKLETSDAFVYQERQAIGMLHRLVFGREQSFYDTHVQLAESTLGTIASGGTLANVSALWCARNRRLGPKPGFAGIHQAGMSDALRAYGFRRAVVIGPLMHYSFGKAVDLLGIGRLGLTQRTGSVLLRGHPVHRAEPIGQRLARVLEDRPGCH